MSRQMNSNTPLFVGQKTHPLSKEERKAFLKKVREVKSGIPLFVGQKMHPLSRKEKEAFLKKIHVKSGDAKIIYNALSDTLDNNLPVRRFVREVNLNYPNISFDINVVPKLDDPSVVGEYHPSEKKIYLEATYMTTKEKISEILCHEMLHQIQHESLPGLWENPVLKDAETMALSCAIDIYRDPAFFPSLQNNVLKWEKIAKGQTPRPSWAPPFKCLVPGKEDEAFLYYVMEMALLETKAEYIQDFVQIEQWGKNGKTHLPNPSYSNYATQQSYKRKPFYSEKQNNDEKVMNKRVQIFLDIMKRNPGLKLNDFEDMYKYMHKYASLEGVKTQEEYDKKEYENIEQSKALDKIYTHIEQLSPSEKERLASKLPEELRNKDLTKYEKKVLLSIVYVMESNELRLEAKKEHISWAIRNLKSYQKGEPTPERKYAIKQLEKLNGYKMPVVQNTTNSSLQNRLLDSSKPYDEDTSKPYNDVILPNLPHSRGGNNIA